MKLDSIILDSLRTYALATANYRALDTLIDLNEDGRLRVRFYLAFPLGVSETAPIQTSILEKD